MNDFIVQVKNMRFRLPKNYCGLDNKDRAVMLDDVIDLFNDICY